MVDSVRAVFSVELLNDDESVISSSKSPLPVLEPVDASLGFVPEPLLLYELLILTCDVLVSLLDKVQILGSSIYELVITTYPLLGIESTQCSNPCPHPLA